MHREYDRSYIYRSLYTVPSRLQFPLPPVLFMMQSLHLQSVFSIIPGNTALNFLPAISTISTFNISFTWSAIFATFLPGSSQPLYYLIISAHVISFLSLFLFVYSLWALTFFYGVLRELSIVVLILTGRLFTHIFLWSIEGTQYCCSYSDRETIHSHFSMEYWGNSALLLLFWQGDYSLTFYSHHISSYQNIIQYQKL